MSSKEILSLNSHCFFFFFWFTDCYNRWKVIWNDLNYDRNGCKHVGGLWKMIITKGVNKKETKSNRVLLWIYESVKLDVRVVVHKSSKDKICLCMNNRFIFKPSNTTEASLYIFTSQVLFELTRHTYLGLLDLGSLESFSYTKLTTATGQTFLGYCRTPSSPYSYM